MAAVLHDDEDSFSGDESSNDSSDTYFSLLDIRASIGKAQKRSWSDACDTEAGPSKKPCTEAVGLVSYSVPEQALTLLTLPTELLEEILSRLTYGELSKVRGVCRTFRQTCERSLNKAFHRIRSQVMAHFQRLKSQMPRRESARRKHPLARECDIIETLHMRLTLLHMTFGKHVEREHCSFFAGEILDEILKIMKYVHETNPLGRAYRVTDELFDLSTMALEYFKDRIEPILPEISYFSDFSDFATSTPKPPPRTMVLSLQSMGPNGMRVHSRRTVVHNTQQAPQVDAPAGKGVSIVTQLKRAVKRALETAMTAQKELRVVRRRATEQQKQLQEVLAKQEQQERRLDESDRRIDMLMNELLARGWAQECSPGNLATRHVIRKKRSRHVNRIGLSPRYRRYSSPLKTSFTDRRSSSSRAVSIPPSLAAVSSYLSDTDEMEDSGEMRDEGLSRKASKSESPAASHQDSHVDSLSISGGALKISNRQSKENKESMELHSQSLDDPV